MEIHVHTILNVTLMICFYNYVDEECETRNGKASGACAEGYGVCCVCKYKLKYLLHVLSFYEEPVQTIPTFVHS